MRMAAPQLRPVVVQNFHLFPATARFDRAACGSRTTAADGANMRGHAAGSVNPRNSTSGSQPSAVRTNGSSTVHR